MSSARVADTHGGKPEEYSLLSSLLRSLTDELRFNEPGNAVTLILNG